MIKSIEKLKVRIDQNLNRAEKSEALSEDVAKIENRINSLKQVSQLIQILIFQYIFIWSFPFSFVNLSQKSCRQRLGPPLANWEMMGPHLIRELGKLQNSH